MKNRSPGKKTIHPFWTIWFPLIVMLVLIFMLAILIIVVTAKDIAASAVWAQISTILLIIPAMLAGILILIILLLSIKGMKRLIPGVSPFLFKARITSQKARHFTSLISKILVTPFLWLHKSHAYLQSCFKFRRPSN